MRNKVPVKGILEQSVGTHKTLKSSKTSLLGCSLPSPPGTEHSSCGWCGTGKGWRTPARAWFTGLCWLLMVLMGQVLTMLQVSSFKVDHQNCCCSRSWVRWNPVWQVNHSSRPDCRESGTRKCCTCFLESGGLKECSSMEPAFLCFDKQGILEEALQYGPILEGGGLCFMNHHRKDVNVVQINKNIITFCRTSLMRIWKIAGTLASPKGMSKYL